MDTFTAEEMQVLESIGKSENFPTWYHGIMGAICQKNTDALVSEVYSNTLPYAHDAFLKTERQANPHKAGSL